MNPNPELLSATQCAYRLGTVYDEWCHIVKTGFGPQHTSVGRSRRRYWSADDFAEFMHITDGGRIVPGRLRRNRHHTIERLRAEASGTPYVRWYDQWRQACAEGSTTPDDTARASVALLRGSNPTTALEVLRHRHSEATTSPQPNHGTTVSSSWDPNTGVNMNIPVTGSGTEPARLACGAEPLDPGPFGPVQHLQA